MLDFKLHFDQIGKHGGVCKGYRTLEAALRQIAKYKMKPDKAAAMALDALRKAEALSGANAVH